MICKYNNFILEKQFDSIIDEIFLTLESNENWIDDNTIEWIISNPTKFDKIKNKLKNFLSKLPKEKIKEYFYKLVNKLNFLPKRNKKKILLIYSMVFLSFVPISYLIPDNSDKDLLEIKSEIVIEKEIKSSFEEAQELVKDAEGGYSDDKKDIGNFVNTPYGKRLVGTNHGISAQILADYMGTLPTKEDMKKLSYETALEIYKEKYWDAQNLSEFKDQSIANIIYDGCVNHGINGMKPILRNIYNNNDIKISNKENPFDINFIKLVNEKDQQTIFNEIKAGREKKYRSLESFKTYGNGWLNRLDKFKYPEKTKEIKTVNYPNFLK